MDRKLMMYYVDNLHTLSEAIADGRVHQEEIHDLRWVGSLKKWVFYTNAYVPSFSLVPSVSNLHMYTSEGVPLSTALSNMLLLLSRKLHDGEISVKDVLSMKIKIGDGMLTVLLDES